MGRRRPIAPAVPPGHGGRKFIRRIQLRGESTVAHDAQSSAVLAGNARTLSRKAQALEVSVLLFLIVPSSILALFVVRQTSPGFVITAIAAILRDLAWASLVLFFVWRNAESVQAIGWTFKSWPRQVVLGVLFFPFMFLGARLVAGLLLGMGFSGPNKVVLSGLSVRNWLEVPLAVLLVAVVAVTEETIFRGYLLLRLKALSGNEVFAVILSTLIFTMGHVYEGGAGLGAVALMGLIFAFVYLRTGSLVASVVMHFLQDFAFMVVIPLLRGTIQ
jgi:uncharacterized protein